jgi:hypothetical protein
MLRSSPAITGDLMEMFVPYMQSSRPGFTARFREILREHGYGP